MSKLEQLHTSSGEKKEFFDYSKLNVDETKHLLETQTQVEKGNLNLYNQEVFDTLSDEDKTKVSEEYIEETSLEYNFLQQNPKLHEIIARLEERNKLKINYKKGEIKFDVNFEYSNGGGAAPTYKNYNIVITKQGTMVNGELAIPGLFNDEKYPKAQQLDRLINTIKARIMKNEAPYMQSNLDDTMSDIKKVFKKLILDE